MRYCGRQHQSHLNLLTAIVSATLLIAAEVAIVWAQEKPTPGESIPSSAANALTVEDVQSRLKKLDDIKELDPSTKAKLTETYTNAMEQLKAAADATARTDQLVKFKRNAAETLESQKAELGREVPNQSFEVPPDATLLQLQQILSQSESKLVEVQKSLQDLQAEPSRRAARRLEIPKLAESSKLQLVEIDRQLETKAPLDESAEVSVAMRILLEARKSAIVAESAANQAELALYEATGELLPAQRDHAAQRVAQVERQVKILRVQVNDRRRQDAERQAREAAKTSAQAHPEIRKIAGTNAELAKLRQQQAAKIESTTRELEQINAQIADLEAQFKKVTTRFDTAGSNEAIGLLLRKQRDELSDPNRYRRSIQQRSTAISNTYLNLIDYEERRNELATLDDRINLVMRSLDFKGKDSQQAVLEEEIRAVLTAQRTIYDSLIADTNNFLDKLVELDVHERQLIARVAEFVKYCNERILWIRSAPLLDVSHFRPLTISLVWLANRRNWREVVTTLATDFVSHPAINVVVWMLLLMLLMIQRSLRHRLRTVGEQASRSNITSYIPTLRALVMTSLLALLWPCWIGYLGARLMSADPGSEFVRAMGQGLIGTALVFVSVEFVRQLCRPNGLGESHFDWDPDTLKLARRTIWWLAILSTPLILVVIITESQPSELIKNSLGRLAFVSVLVSVTLCVHRLTRPVGGAFDKSYAAAPQSWFSRLRRTWHLASLAAPIVLAVLALAGYYYTALELAWRLLASWWLVMGLLVLHAALIRWSLLTYRELAMRKGRERRAAAEVAATAAVPPSAAAAKIIPEVKLSDINKQTRKALQLGSIVGLVAGLWLIWIDVLPALGALGQVGLWMVETPITSGTTTTMTLQPVTLAHLVLAIIITSLTFAGSRNLPSLLEIAVLQRFPFDPGVRYAITTVCRYAITIIGLIGACGAIGLGWYRVQWLVAAISVGLGFGLQEIFANFISGLILLFERPVRPGDIVTVGEVTGHVTRIQMRATTITDWDMRELIVPNKEFITGRVMNWTLSSTVSRMSINVGVAYGTDPDLVRGLLLQVATSNSLVLKDPPPHALFDDFSESTLSFVLRVYMASRDVYLELRHGLLLEIAKEFRQAGVEFAFPQREILLRQVAQFDL